MESCFHKYETTINQPLIVMKINLQPGQQVPNHVIIRALRFWQMENPALQVQVQKKGSKFWFVPLTQGVPYQEVFSEDWKAEFLKLAHERIGSEGILWKVRRVTGPEDCLVLLFHFKHSIIDSASGYPSLVQLVDHMNDLLHGREPQIHHPKPTALMPPCEHYTKKEGLHPHLHRFCYTFLHTLPKWAKTFVLPLGLRIGLPTNSSEKQIRRVFVQKPPYEGSKPIFVRFTKEETTRLLQKTKEHKSTVYGVIAAATRTITQQVRTLGGTGLVGPGVEPKSRGGCWGGSMVESFWAWSGVG